MESNVKSKEELNQENLKNNSEKIKVEYHPHGIYYVIPSQVMDSPYLSAIEKLCYALLSGLANEYGTCFPSDKYLELRLGVCLKTVKRTIKKLTDVGLIEKYTDRSNMMRPKRIITVLNLCPSKRDPYDRGKNDPYDRGKNDPIESKEELESKEKNSSAHFCKYLFKKLKELRPKRVEPNWKKWELDMKRTIEIDRRPPNQIIKIIDWVFDTDNKFVVDCPSSLRSKYENIADHMVMEKNKTIAEEKHKKDPRIAKAIEIIKKYLSKVNNGSLPNQLSFKLQEDGGVYHTVEKRKYSRVYEKFIEALKNHNAPEHLIKMIYEGIKEIK